ncbi:MAG: hypothetical protein QW468_00055 [Candidatus Bathyarchaeia archaeon]
MPTITRLLIFWKEKPSQVMRVIIQYRADVGFSSFVSGLNSLFPTVNVRYRYTLVSAVAVDLPAEAIPQIAKLSSISRIEPDIKVQITLDTAVPVINADRVWSDYGFHGENQTIEYWTRAFGLNIPTFKAKLLGGLTL